MRKGRDGEWKMEKMEKMEKKNNGENSGPLTSLQVDRLTATDCNAAARAKKIRLLTWKLAEILQFFTVKIFLKISEIFVFQT